MPAYKGKNLDNANIGAKIDEFGRHVKFVDGTYMMDGVFRGLTNVEYSALYNSKTTSMTFMIDRGGN